MNTSRKGLIFSVRSGTRLNNVLFQTLKIDLVKTETSIKSKPNFQAVVMNIYLDHLLQRGHEGGF